MGLIFKPGVKFKDGQLAIYANKVMEGVEVAEVAEMMTIAKTKEFFMQGVNDFLADMEAPRDTAWEELFRVVPSTSYGELFPLRTATVAGQGSHGIVFKEVGEGGEIKYSKTSGTHRFVPAVKYATALQYSNEWFEDGQMNLIEMVTEDFREAANDKMAAIHYAALAASVSSGASATAAVGGTTIAHLVNKIDADVVTMRRARRAPTHILMAPEQEQFVAAAMGARTGGTTDGLAAETGRSVSASRLKPLASDHLAAGSLYIVEAKRRLFSVDRQALRLDTFDDLMRQAATLVGSFRRGVLIAEGAALRQITGVPSAFATS